MSRLLNVREIAEQALRKIGAYTTADSAPDGDQLNIAVEALDIVMAHYLSTNNFWFLVPETFSISLTASTQSYDLATTLASDWPDDGLIFPINAVLVENGNYDPLTIIRRDEFDNLDLDETGTPDRVYFDRSDTDTVTMRTWPTLGVSATGYSVNLTAQKFSKQVSGTLVNPLQATGLQAAWSMWLIYQTAAFIGDGTIRRLSTNDIKDFREVAKMSLAELEAFANREHDSNPIAEPWGQ